MGLRSWRWWKAKLGEDAQAPIPVEGAAILVVPEGAAKPLIETDDPTVEPLQDAGKLLEL